MIRQWSCPGLLFCWREATPSGTSITHLSVLVPGSGREEEEEEEREGVRRGQEAMKTHSIIPASQKSSTLLHVCIPPKYAYTTKLTGGFPTLLYVYLIGIETSRFSFSVASGIK